MTETPPTKYWAASHVHKVHKIIYFGRITSLWKFQETCYYKSCREIREDFPDYLSGLYSNQPVLGGKVVTIYCEMAIAGGGFTFVPRTAIRGIESQ